MSGEELDLEALAKHFRSPDLNVRKDEDGWYYLSSLDLAQVADEDARGERAAELVQLLNVGARLLLGGNYFSVFLSRRRRSDSEDGSDRGLNR